MNAALLKKTWYVIPYFCGDATLHTLTLAVICAF